MQRIKQTLIFVGSDDPVETSRIAKEPIIKKFASQSSYYLTIVGFEALQNIAGEQHTLHCYSISFFLEPESAKDLVDSIPELLNNLKSSGHAIKSILTLGELVSVEQFKEFRC